MFWMLLTEELLAEFVVELLAPDSWLTILAGTWSGGGGGDDDDDGNGGEDGGGAWGDAKFWGAPNRDPNHQNTFSKSAMPWEQ